MRIKYLYLLFISFFIIACPAGPFYFNDPYLVNSEIKKGQDLTQEYQDLLSNAELNFGAQEIEKLRQYKIILVPGFLSDVVIDLGKMGPMQVTRLGQYFDDQMQWFEENEIDYERVVIESEASPEFNANIIAASIRKAEKPVLLITHSKGGIDSLEALLRNDDLVQKVKGWLPIQAPFFGSPVADWVIERSNLSTLAFNLLEQLGGTKESLQSLKTDIRIEYLRQNKEDITKLVEAIKIISFTSWKDDAAWAWDTLLEPTRDCMTKKGLKSDGLVPANYAIFPNTDFIQIPNTDHAVPVMHCMLLSFDRISFTKAVLLLLLERL